MGVSVGKAVGFKLDGTLVGTTLGINDVGNEDGILVGGQLDGKADVGFFVGE